MGDDELAEIRRRRMMEMQQQAASQQDEAERQRQYEAQIHSALVQILEPEARERLNTIKLTKPDFAKSVEQQLIMLAQSGRIKTKINDEQLKVILKQVTPAKREFNIRRKG
ncbi:DNA-binding protein [uncultured Methanospirillum sp.]|uniref:DNA-binding protein n=1 Tax=uncultured Methanospirillum sp. TaxID=262503 RepID=UPI0029C8B7B1|nr:DNA-binding protein [uncultured Methanospirillum sp.]